VLPLRWAVLQLKSGLMTNEMLWLTMTLTMTSLFAFPYVINRVAVRGLMGAMRNPSPDDAPLSPWAQRAQRAHYNAIENLVAFAPAALLVHILHRTDALTSTACALYFYARLVHFCVYTAGIPVLRTLAWTGGWVAIMMLLLRLLGLV
jgi:uncharacterized MAPEG superfamily protein